MEKKARRRRSVSSRTFIVMLALVLVIGCAVGGTVAWLTQKTDAVVNTFTYGDINIELFEHNYDATTNTLGTNEVKKVENYKIIPGRDLPKDPTVRVKGGSEACWLFVKVEQTGTFVANKVTYSVMTGIDGWTALTDNPGVYYREVAAATSDTSFNILEDNKVTVSDTLTKAEVNSINAENQPKLTFTAYAVQKDGIDTATAAWEKVNANSTNP